MNDLFEIVSNMKPEKALTEITTILGHLMSTLDKDTRERYLMNLLSQYEDDKVASMVHL